MLFLSIGEGWLGTPSMQIDGSVEAGSGRCVVALFVYAMNPYLSR
jgi:hypothetical protein